MKEKIIELLSDGVFRSQSKIAEELRVDEDKMREKLFKIEGLKQKKMMGNSLTFHFDRYETRPDPFRYIMLYGLTNCKGD